MKQLLADLRKRLSALPRQEAVRAITEFLNSKADAATHLSFKVGKNGRLDGAPTFRTFLLDYLGQIDPAAAAEYARIILNSKVSADEWALALRNLAWGDASLAGQTLLKQKFMELLAYEPWKQNPSTGYLEAFDVAPFLGDASLADPLAGLLAIQDNPAVAHAAFLALDRLVINEPSALLKALEADPGLLQGRENTRADYFARANVGDPQQRQILESYLLNPQIGATELQQFAGIFPNANYMISPNLLTSNPAPDRAALVARDQASLLTVGEWLADPRFANLRPQLQRIQGRLQQFVRQEQIAGP